MRLRGGMVRGRHGGSAARGWSRASARTPTAYRGAMNDRPDANPAPDDPAPNDPMASVRPYLQLASGLLGMSAAKAAELAQGLWTQGGETVSDAMDTAVEQGGQVAALVSPDQVRAMVREEVDRVVRRLGFAREDEVASLRREVSRLEQQVAALESHLQDVASSSEGHEDRKHDKKHKGKKG